MPAEGPGRCSAAVGARWASLGRTAGQRGCRRAPRRPRARRPGSSAPPGSATAPRRCAGRAPGAAGRQHPRRVRQGTAATAARSVARCLAGGVPGGCGVTIRPLGGPLPVPGRGTGAPPAPPTIRLRAAVLPGGLGAQRGLLPAARRADRPPGFADGRAGAARRRRRHRAGDGPGKRVRGDGRCAAHALRPYGRILAGIGRGHVLARRAQSGLPPCSRARSRWRTWPPPARRSW